MTGELLFWQFWIVCEISDFHTHKSYNFGTFSWQSSDYAAMAEKISLHWLSNFRLVTSYMEFAQVVLHCYGL